MDTPRLTFNKSKAIDSREVLLKDITTFIKNGYTYKSDGDRKKRYKVTRIESISSGEININKLGSTDTINESFLLKDGDILYSHINSLPYIGNCALYNNELGPIYHGMNLLNIRPNHQVIPSYLLYVLKSSIGKKYAFENAQRAVSQCSISASIVSSMKIPLPSLSEQKKIADFLSSYDEKISIQRERVEALERRKKGLLQKVFSQEIRFKDEDGRMYGKWDSKTIGDVTVPTAGATPSTKNGSYWIGGDIPWMSSGEVHNGQIYKTEKFITAKGYSNSSTKLLPPNTVVVALAGQGKTRGAVAITRIKLCTNQSLAGLVLKEGSNVISDYLYQYLKNQYSELRKVSSGEGGRGGLNLNIISEFPIMLPSLKEQRKISDFFTVIDDQLNIEKERLATMETIKKGLLQGLFC